MVGRRWKVGLLLAVLLGVLAWPGPGLRADEQARLFPETGWRVEGQLLSYWQQNGGLPVFGFPIGPQQEEQTPDGRFSLQRLERARLELHPENPVPYQVLLGRLGADLLARQGRDWRAEADERLLPGACRSFSQTGRAVCGPFLEYWTSHGLELGDAGISARESLALFGLPLTGTRVELNSSGHRVVTQWFERARFEYHPQNRAPYQVLLGRLGAELYGEPPPLQRPEVRILPSQAVPQGRTIALEAELAAAMGMNGRLGETPLVFIKQGNRWTTVAAVHGLQQPGAVPLVVEATLPDGRIASTSISLKVLDAGYPTEHINLPPSVVDSIERNRDAVSRENALVRSIWPQVTTTRLWQGRFILPAKGRFSSSYGTRRSYNGGPVDSFHEGVDISNVTGTPIVAPARGRVVLAGTGFVLRGGAVILDHGWGVHTGYWHMSEVLVKEGDLVEQGQTIGLMGAEGMVTGPHLHWELRIGPNSADPRDWMEQDWPPE